MGWKAGTSGKLDWSHKYEKESGVDKSSGVAASNAAAPEDVENAPLKPYADADADADAGANEEDDAGGGGSAPEDADDADAASDGAADDSAADEDVSISTKRGTASSSEAAAAWLAGYATKSPLVGTSPRTAGIAGAAPAAPAASAAPSARLSAGGRAGAKVKPAGAARSDPLLSHQAVFSDDEDEYSPASIRPHDAAVAAAGESARGGAKRPRAELPDGTAASSSQCGTYGSVRVARCALADACRPLGQSQSEDPAAKQAKVHDAVARVHAIAARMEAS